MRLVRPKRYLAGWLVVGVCIALGVGAQDLLINESSLLLEIQSVAVNGKPLPVDHAQTLRLPPEPATVMFGFGAATNSTRVPMRIRYKLEGYDEGWHQTGGEMYLIVRFYNAAGDRLDEQVFKVMGDSAGWSGTVDGSPLHARREKVVVPPRATGFWVVISSAGPPATLGVYVVDNLTVSKVATNGGPATPVGRSPFGTKPASEFAYNPPPGWVQDGTRPSMAKVIKLGKEPSRPAFAIVDDDIKGHAEWHTSKDHMPQVAPGDELVLEWNEMYTMGVGDIHAASYANLPDGDYRFRIIELTGLGKPTGVEASMRIVVPLPFWKQPWVWVAGVMLAGGVFFGAGRYVAWQKIRGEMTQLKHQQMLETERMRIARDIHDDLGARVTQISLVSAMAQRNLSTLGKAQADFNEISLMARELVSALYETVWAVEPENDNLEALGDYLCQTVNRLCEGVQLRCRLNVLDLPRDVQISSQVRHNLIMAIKEAVHNTIKHAKASEISVVMACESGVLAISLEDNGRGFDPATQPAGNGLSNMRRRLGDTGGRCSIESKPGQGTIVRIRLELRQFDQRPVRKPGG